MNQPFWMQTEELLRQRACEKFPGVEHEQQREQYLSDSRTRLAELVFRLLINEEYMTEASRAHSIIVDWTKPK